MGAIATRKGMSLFASRRVREFSPPDGLNNNKHILEVVFKLGLHRLDTGYVYVAWNKVEWGKAQHDLQEI